MESSPRNGVVSWSNHGANAVIPRLTPTMEAVVAANWDLRIRDRIYDGHGVVLFPYEQEFEYLREQQWWEMIEYDEMVAVDDGYIQ